MGNEEKKVENLDNINVVGTLTPGQYWEWRCTIEELQTSKHAATIAQLKLRTMELEMECTRLRVAIFKESVKEANANSVRVEAGYQTFRETLEKTVGFQLKDCVIDPYNYTVKKLN